MSRTKRPTAADLGGFDDIDLESQSDAPSDWGSSRLTPYSHRSTSLPVKRKDTGIDSEVSIAAKRTKSTSALCYRAHANDLDEQTTEFPEELFQLDDKADGPDELPIRELADFCFFDPTDRNRMVPLDGLESDDVEHRYTEFSGAGYAKPVTLDDEDDNEEEVDDVVVLPTVHRLQLGAIFEFWLDYTDASQPLTMKTSKAWYNLCQPAEVYREIHATFFRPHRIAQIVLASAGQNPLWSYDQFLEFFVGIYDENFPEDNNRKGFQEADLACSVAALQRGLSYHPKLKQVPFVRSILSSNEPSSASSSRQGSSIPVERLSGTLGGSVLTPMVARHAEPYIEGKIYCMGPPEPSVDPVAEELQALQRSQQLADMLASKAMLRRQWDVEKKPGSTRVIAVNMEGNRYELGTSILGPIGIEQHKSKKTTAVEPTPIETTSLADSFWASRIVDIDANREVFHVHYYEFMAKSILGPEFSNPQELFVTPTCGVIDFNDTAGIIVVKRCERRQPPANLASTEFFVRLEYNQALGEFTTPEFSRHDVALQGPPGHRCYVCQLASFTSRMETPQYFSAPSRIKLRDKPYHLGDYVLWRSSDGPANIGKITRFIPQFGGKESPQVHIRRLGRLKSIQPSVLALPDDLSMDERHLYITEETTSFAATELIRVVYVLGLEDGFSGPELGDKQRHADQWLLKSPYHFLLLRKFQKLNFQSWVDQLPLNDDDTGGCELCHEDHKLELKSMRRFVANEPKVRVLDACSGAGGLGGGFEMEDVTTRVGWNVEIDENAALATKANMPRTHVINQDLDTFFRHTIKHNEQQAVGPLHQRYDPHEEIGPNMIPAQSGEVDGLLAGIPCPPHSSLNMFKHANDPRTYLLFTVLSMVDYFDPKFFVFENVKGFLGFNLGAKQAGPHRFEGGLSMSGLRIMIFILTQKGYQVRWALLQSMDYGAPQDRIRFILVATQIGYRAIGLPSPTHQHPNPHGLKIKDHTSSRTLNLYFAPKGVAPHPFTSIHDAISDLHQFDWKPPVTANQQERETRIQRQQEGVPSIECSKKDNRWWCGFDDKRSKTYQHEPRSRLQVAVRSKSSPNLQHFTCLLDADTVKSVIKVPLEPDADYRQIPGKMRKWQSLHPNSAQGRKGFKAGLFGRMDGTKFSNTVTTNPGPTAKFCKVLHPTNKRMVSVRELARIQTFPDWFIFHSAKDNVKDMHRQIGNAVPIVLSHALALELRKALYEDTQEDKR